MSTKRKYWNSFDKDKRELAYHIKYPNDLKHQVNCEYCLVLFGAKRSDAKFCSSQCRQGHYRNRPR